MDDIGTTCAVVMGDLVQSETRFAPDQLHHVFNSEVRTQNEAAANTLLSPLTITLGDEFQGLLRSLVEAIPLVQTLRLRLLDHGIDCRFVIGLVNIRTPINSLQAWNMMGDGLSNARGLLNEKDDGTYYRFSLPKMKALAAVLDGVGIGLTLIEKNWSRTQREIIAAQLAGKNAPEIAKERGVSSHSIYKVRSAAHYDAYLRQWKAVETLLRQIDSEKGLTT
jgi:hypothetical protein